MKVTFRGRNVGFKQLNLSLEIISNLGMHELFLELVIQISI